jgi:type II secretory pathway component PulF
MIERLKNMIDASEDSPKMKAILLKVAELPESKQEDTLELLSFLLNATGKE